MNPYIIMAIIGGLILPIQVGWNSTVGKITNPMWATLISFVIGTIGLIIYTFVIRTPWPAMQLIKTVPWYAWGGGLLGAVYISITIITAPKIGAALLVSLVVAGQMAAALVLDHYGMCGFPQNSISWLRILGTAMIIAGVVLIQRY
jgi:transporter family-2 protein